MNNLPPTLYKYVEPKRVDILETLKIRFTPRDSFNDPFDLYPAVERPSDGEYARLEKRVADTRYWKLVLSGYKISRKEFDKLHRPHQQNARKFLEEHPDFYQEELVKRQTNWTSKVIGILCLTETKNNLLMWSHYTDSHRGFLIEFDPDHSFFNKPHKDQQIDFGSLVKVDYPKTDNRPKFVMEDNASIRSVFTTKSECWTYEQEWRIFQRLDQCPQPFENNGEKIHLFDLPPESITGIVIGCRMNERPEYLKKLVHSIKSNPKLSHLVSKVQLARQDSKKFKLNYVPTEI